MLIGTTLKPILVQIRGVTCIVKRDDLEKKAKLNISKEIKMYQEIMRDGFPEKYIQIFFLCESLGKIIILVIR